MKLTDFEKYYQKQVSNHSSDLDTESLWDALEPQLEKPEKKRRFIFWIVGVGMLTFFSFALYQFLDLEIFEKKIIVLEEQNAPEVNESRNTPISAKNDNQIAEEEPLVTDLEIEKPKTINQQEVLKTEIFSKENVVAPFGNTIIQNSTQNTFVATDSKIIESASIDLRMPDSSFSILIIDKIAHLETEEKPIDLPKIEVLKPKSKWHYLVGTNIGYAQSSRKISAKTDDAEPFLQKRKNTETVLELLSTGIDLELKNQNNWSILLGISGNQLTERFDFEDEFSVNGIVTDTTEITYRENGDILASQGSVVQTTDIYQLRKVYNTFRWLETKAGVGYARQFRRFELGVAGGALIGFGLNTNGVVLAENGGYQDLKESGSSIYKSNLGWGVFSNINIKYHFSSKWQIFTGAEFKNYQNSFTKSDYPLAIKYSTSGLKVGVQYRLK